MKIRKSNILFGFSLAALIAFSGCEKDDGPIPEDIAIVALPAITTNIDPTGSPSISISSPGTFTGKFKVDMYFPGETPPTKVDIVVRKNASATGTITNGNVKVFKTNISSFPTSFTVTVAEIQALFGAPIVLKEIYDFAPDIYLGDRKFEAFPAVGTGTGAGPRGMPNYSEFTRFEVK